MLLEFSNHQEHPADPKKIVFYFFEEKYCVPYAEALKNAGIQFEFVMENYKHSRLGTDKMYCFIVSKKDFKKANQLSYLTYAKFRKPALGSKTFGLFLVTLMIFLLILSIIGYLKSV
ncbi:MAG: hypothetical protein KatS3mg034_0097 [Vicingaceae bacterium]|nr:MAG: hypothetical protein KatS3mg034_0097 [Vicingaceae bacterium]